MSRICDILARRHDVEALEPAAAADEPDRAGAVRVRRFPSLGKPKPHLSAALRQLILSGELTEAGEREIVRAQGPYCPELVSWLADHGAEYDALVFRHAVDYATVAGLPLAGRRAILVPVARDEPLLYLDIMDEVFRATPHLFFGSPEERLLVLRRFNLDEDTGRVVGPGVDAPPPVAPAAAVRLRNGAFGGKRIVTCAESSADADGCARLVDYFVRFAEERPEIRAALALDGARGLRIAHHPDIRTGMGLGRDEREALLAVSDVVVAPSIDCGGVSALEASRRGVPLLVNGESAPLRAHCVRSNGGLWYRNYPEFRDALALLLGNAGLRAALGESGRAYVEETCGWDRVEQAYLETLERIRETAGR